MRPASRNDIEELGMTYILKIDESIANAEKRQI
jgi:hypothetical protein